MKYKHYTKDELIDKIRNLEDSKNEALNKRDELIGRNILQPATSVHGIGM